MKNKTNKQKKQQSLIVMKYATSTFTGFVVYFSFTINPHSNVLMHHGPAIPVRWQMQKIFLLIIPLFF